MYASGAVGGYRGGNVAQTATFDASKSGRYNEDALPAMPSWDNATSRKEEVVEMEKLNEHDAQTHGDGMLYRNPEPPSAYGYQQDQPSQSASLLHQQESGRYYGGSQPSPSAARQDFGHNGDMGAMTAQPYHDYQDQRQHQLSPGPYAVQNYASPSPYGSSFHQPTSPSPQYNPGMNTDYYGAGAGQVHQRGYEASIPPSYHTRPPSDIVSPVSPQPQASYPGQASYQPYNGSSSGVGRKPVQGSWREV